MHLGGLTFSFFLLDIFNNWAVPSNCNFFFLFFFLAMSFFDWLITKKKKKSETLESPQYRNIHSKHRSMVKAPILAPFTLGSKSTTLRKP